ncbi:hypothetical protein AAMO2058_000266200 [Amorphochlora amoebiformis]
MPATRKTSGGGSPCDSMEVALGFAAEHRRLYDLAREWEREIYSSVIQERMVDRKILRCSRELLKVGRVRIFPNSGVTGSKRGVWEVRRFGKELRGRRKGCMGENERLSG